jgi:hypothetical protein
VGDGKIECKKSTEYPRSKYLNQRSVCYSGRGRGDQFRIITSKPLPTSFELSSPSSSTPTNSLTALAFACFQPVKRFCHTANSFRQGVEAFFTFSFRKQEGGPELDCANSDRSQPPEPFRSIIPALCTGCRRSPETRSGS